MWLYGESGPSKVAVKLGGCLGKQECTMWWVMQTVGCMEQAHEGCFLDSRRRVSCVVNSSCVIAKRVDLVGQSCALAWVVMARLASSCKYQQCHW
jgi:hypothetical protein